MRNFRSLSVVGTMNALYPRLLAIHDLAEDVGFPAANGRLKLPRFMRASYAWMVPEGAYLLCESSCADYVLGLIVANGEVAMIWFGGGVSPQIIDDLYGVESADELDVRMVSLFRVVPCACGICSCVQTRLPKLPTLLSTQVRNILTHLEGLVGHSMPVIIVRQNVDGMEIEFANQLVEDSNNDALGYTDCELFLSTPTGRSVDGIDLMTAHKSITNELSGSGNKEGWMPWS